MSDESESIQECGVVPTKRQQFERDLSSSGSSVHNGKRFFTVSAAAYWLSRSLGMDEVAPKQSGDESAEAEFSIAWNAAALYESEIERYVKEGAIRQYDRVTLGEIEQGRRLEGGLLTEDGVRELVKQKYPSMELMELLRLMIFLAIDKTDNSVFSGGEEGAETEKEPRGVKSNEFVAVFGEAFVKGNANGDEPISVGQLIRFAESITVQGYKVSTDDKGNNRKIYLDPEKTQSIPYRNVARAFRKWKERRATSSEVSHKVSQK